MVKNTTEIWDEVLEMIDELELAFKFNGGSFSVFINNHKIFSESQEDEHEFEEIEEVYSFLVGYMAGQDTKEREYRNRNRV